MVDGSNLGKAIQSGQFAITAECLPPRGPSTEKIKECAQVLGGLVHTVGAIESEDGARLCSLAACCHLAAAGAEPMLHLLTRDLNRIALQADILGAASMGVHNVLCIAGRHQVLTGEPSAKGVYDVDPIQLLKVASGMRGNGRLASGQELDEPVETVLGTDTNPFADPMDLQVIALERAVISGADFVITQPVFNLDAFGKWMEAIRTRDIPSRICVIASVKPLSSAEEASALRESHRHYDIPDEVISNLRNQSGKDQAVAMIAALRRIEGVRGVHLRTGEDFQLAADVLKASGVSRSE